MNPYRGVPVAVVLCACTVVPLLLATPAAADGALATSRFAAASRDTVKPAAPTGVKATYSTSTRKAKVTWSANRERDLVGYQVFRRLKGSTSWTKLVTTKTRSHTDSPPATGATYHYEVRAYDRAGNTSKGSTDRAVTSVDKTPPGKPSGVTAKNSQPGITVAWKTVPGAKSYVVHRRWEYDGEGNPVLKMATVTSPTWRDTTIKENLDYNYWVTAVDGGGNASAKSAPRFISRGDQAPSAPTTLKAAPHPTGIKLTWKAPTSPTAYDLSKYLIHRNGRLVDEVPIRQTSFIDTGVKHGTSYTYTMTTVDRAGHPSAPSAPAPGTAPSTGLAPAAVGELTGVMDGHEILLYWARSPEDDVSHYSVYRGLLVDGVWQYERWSDVGHYAWDDDPYRGYHQEVYNPQGGPVRWAVVAVDEAGNSLFDSGETFSHVDVIEPPPLPEE
ncbi:cellulose 1,4-beta-cellobiosidase [Streptomyces sp. SID4919]|uniref:fibronectin type III domain-containing protein n=1 Tax=unclassified Streptomyces TaxID=2593676 RepID=UPI000823B03C|nr:MULTISPECIES: cellulose 1,4-beta-cellobiosidase [unclassified Streptomyces]MYY11139.1 cellulose 1,4-beta-cellobiosidase [Streptomyces sp. SID4919]SCK15828.1 Fibronectin type III domain-containing protein [Streptomyces sp. AmelKG-E11A]